MSGAAISNKNEDDARNSLSTVLSSIDYDKIKMKQSDIFQNAFSEGYANVIKVFNEKSVVESIDCYFDIKDHTYCSLVLRLLENKEKRELIIKALSSYLPKEIPR